jgi:hypothetical protein
VTKEFIERLGNKLTVGTNTPLQGIVRKLSRKSPDVDGSSATFMAVENELRLIQIASCGDCESPSMPQPWLMIFDPALLEVIVDLYRRSYWIGRDLEW